MVRTVTSIERERVARKEIGLGSIPPPPNGSGGNGGGGGSGGGGRDDRARFPSPVKARLAMWVALGSILMLFAALASAYIVIASTDGRRALALPHLLWLSTALILASSLTLRTACRSLKQGDDGRYSAWLWLTLLLGLGFLGSQLLAWRQLVAQGVYLAGNPHSAFFYLLTGVHGVHLLGGILALVYLLTRTRRRPYNREGEARRQTAADVVALYWHFMDGIWVFLFLLLLFWG
jgi:cytochrome c oxidase subunit 3